MISLFIAIMFLDEIKIDLDAPIAPKYWEIKEDPQKGIFDAVIIEDKSVLLHLGVERYRLIRILSEQGKVAADFVDTTGTAKNLKGRVIDRSGRVTKFNQKEDLVEVFAYRNNGRDHKTKMIIPPGLSSDCIVEYRWDIRAEDGIPGIGSYDERLEVPEAFYCLKKSFHITTGASRSSGGYLRSRFIWSGIQPPAELKIKKAGGRGKILTYHNIPAVKSHPYGAEYYDANAAYLLCYKTFPDFGRKPGDFYKAFGRQYIKMIMETKFRHGPEYKAFVRRAKSECMNTTQGMVNFHNLFIDTFASSRLVPAHLKGNLKKKRSGSDLKDEVEDLLENKIGDDHALGILYYQLAKELGLSLHVCYTTSTGAPGFQPNTLNPFALRLSQPIFSRKHSNGNRIWFTPHYQQYAAGYIPSFLQGGSSLVFNPKNKWAHEFVNIPRFSYKTHQEINNYAFNISEDGTLKMSLSRQATGNYDALLERRYSVLPEEERAFELKKRWQDRLKNWNVTQASILNIGNHEKGIEILINAEYQIDKEGSSWISIFPFPGDSLPLAPYKIWPKNRTQPILLDYARAIVDFCEITVPNGWKLKGNPSWKKENSIGSIQYRAQQQGNKILVRRDLVIGRDLFGPDKEKELNFFIAWTEEAGYQSIGIDMGSVK